MHRTAFAMLVGAVALSFAAASAVGFQPQSPQVKSKRSATQQTAARKISPNAVGMVKAGKVPLAGGITLDDVQYNVSLINMYRAKVNAPPVKLDSGLSQFAYAGSLELMNAPGHPFHGHYKRVGSQLPQPSAENQFYSYGTARSSQSVKEQIKNAVDAFFNEGPPPAQPDGREHGHYVNLVNAAYAYVGIGLVLDANGYLFLTNDFDASPVTQVPQALKQVSK